MRKGSIIVRASQARALMQYEWFLGNDRNREILLSSRQTKGTCGVVLGGPKDHSATGTAPYSRLHVAQ